MVDAFIEKMRLTSEDIATGKMTLENLKSTILELKVQSMVPHDWVAWLDGWIMKLNPSAWWKEVTAVPDYRSMKYSRRFFPMSQFGAPAEKKAEWKELTAKVMKDEYPEFKDAVHANMTPLSKTDITNFGVIPPRKPTEPTFKLSDFELVVDILGLIKNDSLLGKLLYYILTSYDTCHMMYTNETVDRLIVQFWNTEKWKDIIVTGLWYGNYILAHEEELTREGYVAWTPDNRCLLRASELPRIKWLKLIQDIDIEFNPLVTVARAPVPLVQRSLFYLEAKRSIVRVEELAERINQITAGSMRGFEKFGNVALVGSTLTECVGDVQLGRDWKTKSRLYYSGGDIDIAVHSPSYKEYIDQVYDMIGIMNDNLGTSVIVKHVTAGSGIRYNISHPKLPRAVEIFRTPNDLIRLVQGFHVPCVKALWNFKDLIMSRSFLTAMLTGICESFDWFSSNKIPLDVVLKNAQRGYSLVLNTKEMQCAEEYLKKADGPWSYTGLARQKAMTGIFTPDHIFFRVDVVPKGVRFGMPIEEALLGSSPGLMSSHLQPVGLRYKGEDISKCYGVGSGNVVFVKPPPAW